MRNLCLLTAALMLAGCATSTPPSTQRTKPPPLDSALAAPCPTVEKPNSPDYDVWQAWAINLLQQYAGCAARHTKTVQAWPK